MVRSTHSPSVAVSGISSSEKETPESPFEAPGNPPRRRIIPSRPSRPPNSPEPSSSSSESSLDPLLLAARASSPTRSLASPAIVRMSLESWDAVKSPSSIAWT